MSRRALVTALLASIAMVAAAVIAAAVIAPRPADRSQIADPRAGGLVTGPSPSLLAPIPVPGHEVYGFVPYWEMDDEIAAHLGRTDVTRLGLFSVTHTKSGTLAGGERGYRRITGEIGRRIIAEAHDRGVRVDLVYTSFGLAKNRAFFGSGEAQARTIAELADLAEHLGVDGINVDIEQLDADLIAAYGVFVEHLREALEARVVDADVTVATTANVRGTAMAAVAATAGAERIFMMGYDYHWSGSDAGASAPLDRRDGSEKDLPWSLDLYRDAGVPVERTILGLPLYGMSWPASGPEPGAPTAGRGTVWVPRHNLALLADPTLTPTYDRLEGVEVLTLPDGRGWQQIYYDSPASLAPKLALADARGLAGAGFWALGYERGLPDYTRLIAAFRSGELAASAADPGADPAGP
jgi:spore germination protein YaaH